MASRKSSPKTAAERKKVESGKNVIDVKTPLDDDLNHSIRENTKERIFLSIDAIDSTKLKSSLAAKQGSTPAVWAKDFAIFLTEIAAFYQGEFVAAIDKHCPDNCPSKRLHRMQESSPQKVKVWKYIGDEVVLVAELTCDKHQPSLHVLALANTIKQFNRKFGKNNPNKIRFKGTAWVAGFPVRNIEINLPGPEGQEVKDFLGPSMDLGFRLSKAASDDRLLISASLAYLIVKEASMDKPIKLNNNKEYNRLPLCFGGLTEFKGITNKHPLIWYSVNETPESGLCSVEHEELETFLRKNSFINKEIPPFILGIGDVSPKYVEKYKEAVKEQEKVPGSPFYPKGEQLISSTKEGVATTSELDALFEDISSKLAK